VLASLATISADGSPQITPLWIDVDGDDLLVNTAEGRRKARNMHTTPTLPSRWWTPMIPTNVVAVRGTVIDMTTRVPTRISTASPRSTWRRRVPDAHRG